MKLTTLEALFVEELKGLYDAENQLLRALPKMAKGATAPQLREAFTETLHQTQLHVHRLDKIFGQLGVGPKGSDCRAMEGLIADAKELQGEEAQRSVMDAALIAAAQRLQHIEIAGYSSVRTLARQLGYNQAADALQTSLDEREAADEKLRELAMTVVGAGVTALNSSK